MTQSMTPHRQWWKHPYTWVAIVVVIVLVTVVLAATLGHRSQSGTPSATQPSTATAVPSTSLPSGSDGTYAGSGLDSLGHGYRIPVNAAGHALPQSARPSSSTLTSPLAAPQGLEWQRVYGAPVPFSTSDGPREVHSDGTVSGFSHTPQGAALASWQYFTRLMVAPPDVRKAVLAQSTSNGSDRSLTSKLPDYSSYSDAGSSAVVPAGVKIAADKYTPTTAFVVWALGPLPAPDEHPTDSGYAYTEQRIGVVWQDGDWKLNLGDWATDDTLNWFDTVDAASGWSTWT